MIYFSLKYVSTFFCREISFVTFYDTMYVKTKKEFKRAATDNSELAN